MQNPNDSLAVSLFSEILMVDQLARNNVAKVLPKGMELSHFSVLNLLAHTGQEKTPAQLARTFHLTRGAMTNTLGKLKWNGWVQITPLIADVVSQIGADKVRAALPVLRELRIRLSGQE
jgi:DNA-binding MarR family transcriptional regulator